MRRFPDLLVGFLAGFAVLLIVFFLTSDFAAHYEICKEGHAGAKECTSYDPISYVLFKLWAALDALNGAITAIATAFIAWFTLTLRRSTDKLWDAGEKQIRLARDEFVSTHRPRVVVRGVSLATAILAGQRVEVTISAMNVGETTGIIREMRARVYLVQPFTWLNVGNDFHQVPLGTPPPFVSGSVTQFTVRGDVPLTQSQVLAVAGGTTKLVCVGYVIYRDTAEVSASRMTGFARMLEPTSSRFLAITDPDYEFSY